MGSGKTPPTQSSLHLWAPESGIRRLAKTGAEATSWCGQGLQGQVNCPTGIVLEFLQERFSAGLTPSTLKVYVEALAAYHAPLGGQSLGRDLLVNSFHPWHPGAEACTSL